MNADRMLTEAQAVAKGFTVDNCAAGRPIAYKGPRFAATETAPVFTELEVSLMAERDAYKWAYQELKSHIAATDSDVISPNLDDEIAARIRAAGPYNAARIAWELERTAMGDGHFGNALRVAKDMPGVTDDDRALLDRYATGRNTGTDHVALQDLALRIDPVTQAARSKK